MPSLSLAYKGYLSTYMPTLYVKNRYNLLLFQSIPENGGGKIRQTDPEGMQGTTAFHYPIADALLPQADAVCE